MGRKSSVFFELFLKIETAARELREKLRLKDRRVPNVLELLHVLSSLTGWTVEYVDAHPHSKKVLAWVDGDKKILFVLNKTKKKLEYGNDTERERIAHELGHLALGHKGLLYDMQSRSYSVHTTEEMEAALFVPMFLAPRDLSGSCKSTAELRGQFHLTASTARTWLKNLRKIELEEHQQQLNLHRDKPKQEIEKHQPYDFLSLVKNRPDDKNRTNLLAQFELFRGNGGGLEEWFTENISDLAVEAITNVENSPLSRERVNQLLVLSTLR